MHRETCQCPVVLAQRFFPLVGTRRESVIRVDASTAGWARDARMSKGKGFWKGLRSLTPGYLTHWPMIYRLKSGHTLYINRRRYFLQFGLSLLSRRLFNCKGLSDHTDLVQYKQIHPSNIGYSCLQCFPTPNQDSIHVQYTKTLIQCVTKLYMCTSALAV